MDKAVCDLTFLLCMQSSPFTQVNESPFNPVTQPSAVSNATQYTGSSDAQYFQTAQMKLHAREQRLQVLALAVQEKFADLCRMSASF